MQANYCGTCGLAFNPPDTHCGRCGTRRDIDTPGSTAFSTSSNATTVERSNAQTYCINCGHPRLATVFPCPFCNSSIPTLQALSPIAQQMATDIPTPPLIVKDPPQQQIHAAMVGTVNPYGYGLWGDLVVDGSKKNVWDFPFRARGGGVLNAGLLTRVEYSSEWGLLHIMPNIHCQDFAYQVAVSIERLGQGGLAFRIDETEDECYVFERLYYLTSSTKFWYGLTINISSTTYLRSKENLFYDGGEQYNTGRTALLAVVAQGTTLDFYIDLKHVKRLETRFVTSGSVGLCTTTNHGTSSSFEARHTKLWVKNP